jgi:hypothetical protein
MKKQLDMFGAKHRETRSLQTCPRCGRNLWLFPSSQLCLELGAQPPKDLSALVCVACLPRGSRK